jgi:hypothetical protein
MAAEIQYAVTAADANDETAFREVHPDLSGFGP